MILVMTMLADVVIFCTVALVVLTLERRIGAAATVRRRIQGEVAGGAPADSVVRRETVRNPILAWAQNLTLSEPDERERLRGDLARAGFDFPSAPPWYVVIRFGLAIGLPTAFVLAQGLLAHPATGLELIFIPLLLAVVALIAPRAFIDNRISARRTQLEMEFPDALDLLVVCVEAGLGLDTAFVRVGEEVAESHPRISQEFELVAQELRAGRSRPDALRRFADRAQVDVVTSLVALLIQADALGASITESLRTYSQEMRQRRVLKAEEKAARIPVLLTIPLVACILPAIVTAVMLPAVIGAMRDLMPAMSHLRGH